MSTVDVALDGEVDVATASEMRARLAAAIDGNPGGTIRVDLSAVEFLDSTGLGILVSTLRRVREQGGEMVLHAPPPRVQKVFEITGLSKVFTIQHG